MAYHRWPTKFNWSSIGTHPATNNAEAQRLGVVLRKDLKSEYSSTSGTGTTIENARSVFRDYGYGASIQDYNIYNTTQTQKIGDEVAAGRPVYMRGANINNGGHAWVCDGYRYGFTGYSALYLDRDLYRPGKYSWYSGVTKGAEIKYFHMNWGYRGDNNGWLYSRSADKYETTPFSSTGEGDFSNNRRLLFVTPRK